MRRASAESATATNVTFPETLELFPGDASDRLGISPPANTVGDVTINPQTSPSSRPATFRTTATGIFTPGVRASYIPGGIAEVSREIAPLTR